jgi:hypothetical protein
MDTKQNFEDLINGAMTRMANERKASATNMRLGQLIDSLASCNQSLPVHLADGNAAWGFMSYRGYYEDLAISPRSDAKIVADVLAEARAALGEAFEGYKGGDYPMHKGSLLWVAEYGNSGGNMLVGVRQEADRVILETELHDDYK